MKPRVLLISTVHPSDDPRIVHKIAPSLVEKYEVICFLPSAGSGRNEWRTLSMPFYTRLFWRVLLCHPKVLWQGLFLRPAVVHIFVPELIPLALILQWAGARVIYEVQENLFKKFEIKRYNNSPVFQKLFAFFDQVARRKFRVVVTEKAYLEEYRNLKFEPTLIQNFVSVSFIDRFVASNDLSGRPLFLYMGVISMERCFDTLIAALVILKQTHSGFRVALYGPVRFDMKEAENLPGFEAVKDHLEFHGYTDQRAILSSLNNVVAGLALLKPVGDYPDSYPTKLFEYMALRLPVIVSDFPLYKAVVDQAMCGFCINPSSPEQLARVMRDILDNPGKALMMGVEGRNAVMENYNWENEKKILLELYSKVIGAEIDKLEPNAALL